MDIKESRTGDVNGYVQGQYEYTMPDGSIQIVKYQDIGNGYEAKVEIVPAPSGSYKSAEPTGPYYGRQPNIYEPKTVKYEGQKPGYQTGTGYQQPAPLRV